MKSRTKRAFSLLLGSPEGSRAFSSPPRRRMASLSAARTFTYRARLPIEPRGSSPREATVRSRASSALPHRRARASASSISRTVIFVDRPSASRRD